MVPFGSKGKIIGKPQNGPNSQMEVGSRNSCFGLFIVTLGVLHCMLGCTFTWLHELYPLSLSICLSLLPSLPVLFTVRKIAEIIINFRFRNSVSAFCFTFPHTSTFLLLFFLIDTNLDYNCVKLFMKL